jgi:hypothetical protein
MMPVMGFGAAPAFQPVNAQVRERTGLGFTIDYIRIPIPVIKPIAVQRPAEVTFHMQHQQQQGGVGFAPVAAGFAPMAGGFGAVPMPFGAGIGGASMGLVPQASIGYGQVTYQSQVPIGQVPQPPAAGAPMCPTPQPPAAGAPVCTPPPKTQEQLLEECMKKLEESQRKLRELEKREQDKKDQEKK